MPKAQAANGVAGSWELNVDSKSYASDNTSDDDNSDNDSDYMDKDAIFDSRVARDCKRPPIHSEVISEDQDDVIETEKSPGEIAKIISILEQKVIFRHFELEQKKFLTRAMFVKKFKTGDIIMKSGDVGEHFYIIDQGRVEFFKSDDPDNEVALHTYSPGDSFGDLAIMYSAPQTTTCRAMNACRLYALDRKTFKKILTKTTIENRLKIKSILQNVEVLKQLKESEFLTMADAMQEIMCKEGDVVCRQGDAGSNFYIIKEGAVTCAHADAQGKQHEVARLTVGDCFGETALFASYSRQATVTAAEGNGTLKLLYLDRSTFNRIFGPIEGLLRRDLAAYNKFRAAQI